MILYHSLKVSLELSPGENDILEIVSPIYPKNPERHTWEGSISVDGLQSVFVIPFQCDPLG